MSNKKIREIRNLTKDELVGKLREAEEGLFKNRMKKVTGQLEDMNAVWKNRKEVARLKMVLGELDGKSNKKEIAHGASK